MEGDLYTVLGVRRDATGSEIKQAFRRLARLLHPDRNQLDPAAAEERFKRVASAYEVLSDVRRRRLYDRSGERGPEGQPDSSAAAEGEPATAPGSVNGRRGPAAERRGFLNDLFGRSLRAARARRGANLSCSATLDLAEVVRGCEREVRVRGSDGAPDRVVRARIPSGVRDGERLRLRGLGRPGSRGGEPGDLLLTVHLRPHPHFSVEGVDLHLDLPVTPLEAYDGANVQIATPHGPMQVRVPARSQGGTTLRVPSRGVRRGTAEPGDLFLHLRVVLPTAEGLRDIYAHLDGAIREDVRQGLRSE